MDNGVGTIHRFFHQRRLQSLGFSTQLRNRAAFGGDKTCLRMGSKVVAHRWMQPKIAETGTRFRGTHTWLVCWCDAHQWDNCPMGSVLAGWGLVVDACVGFSRFHHGRKGAFGAVRSGYCLGLEPTTMLLSFSGIQFIHDDGLRLLHFI